MSKSSVFSCPACGAQYKVVEVMALPADTHDAIYCVRCGAELPERDGANFFKYFLVDDPDRRGTASRHSRAGALF